MWTGAGMSGRTFAGGALPSEALSADGAGAGEDGKEWAVGVPTQHLVHATWRRARDLDGRLFLDEIEGL